jgi:hypothetical protein
MNGSVLVLAVVFSPLSERGAEREEYRLCSDAHDNPA